VLDGTVTLACPVLRQPTRLVPVSAMALGPCSVLAISPLAYSPPPFRARQGLDRWVPARLTSPGSFRRPGTAPGSLPT